MQIDYGKIVTNALSTLVAAVFVGAAAIVWQAANSVDDRVNEANEEILKQQSNIKATQEVIVPELTRMKGTIEDLTAEISSLRKLLSGADTLTGISDFKSGEAIVLDEFNEKDSDWYNQEADRINEQIDMRQLEIYQQRVPSQ